MEGFIWTLKNVVAPFIASAAVLFVSTAVTLVMGAVFFKAMFKFFGWFFGD